MTEQPCSYCVQAGLPPHMVPADDPTHLRALLAALVEPLPWTYETPDGKPHCFWCSAVRRHAEDCPYVAARAVVAGRGEEGA